MKSTGLGGYLSLINSHSPKTHQNFSFSDTEICANATSGSNEASTSSASEDSSDEQADQEQSQSQNHNHLSKSRWKHKHTNSSSLIKTAAFHIPKCLKPKNQSSSQNQNSSKVCKSLKKSFHHASCLRSKSDNCLNRINNNNYNKVNCATSDGGGAISVDLASSADQSKRSFGQRVANVFASLVLNNHSQTTLVDPDPDHPESSDNLHHRVHLQRSSLRLRPTYSTKKSTVKKATSLERNINHRITEAEEQARRTRSLERNHRHLVTIDSTCRYSREVGSTQINLPDLPAAIEVNQASGGSTRISDFSKRYHPDPTWRPTQPVRKPLTSSSSSASSTSSSASSTQSRDPEPILQASGSGSKRRRHFRTSKMASSATASSSVTTSTPKGKAAAMAPPSNASSSFVSKPARGWLHPDYLFAKDGINYNVRYMGCLEVNTSMKVLDFDTRSAIAKECINRLSEAANGRAMDQSKPLTANPRIARMLSDTPVLDKAGANVQLTITSLWLKLSDLDSGNAIFVHDMPNISFASGGDAEKLDFVAYVAKDRRHVRSCYVLECGGGLAQDVITTIGQAFELRFKEFMKRTPIAKPPPLQVVTPAPRHSLDNKLENDVEYYNDLPGKTPPEFSPVQKSRPTIRDSSCGSSNLIDFHSDLKNNGGGPEYVNDDVANPTRKQNSNNHRDVFDMSPFATNAPGGGFPDMNAMKLQLLKEEWFHGPISRVDAENLLQNDGEFLVRESQASSGQYVLTGMQSNSKKHLLLVDPEGIVRTKDRTFESVSHLINHHRETGRPIISAESALRLVTPVTPETRNF